MTEPAEVFNKDLAQWAKYQGQILRRKVATLTLKDRRALQKREAAQKRDGDKGLEDSIKGSTRKSYGLVYRINLSFAQQGIYLEHGVGKGRPVRSSVARPKPWLAPVLDPALNKLADLIAGNYADIVQGEIKFLIPGILNRRLRIDNG